MKKLLMFMALLGALVSAGCGRQWPNLFGWGGQQSCGGYSMCDPCCDGGFGMGGVPMDGVVMDGYGMGPGFSSGYMPDLPGPEVVAPPTR